MNATLADFAKLDTAAFDDLREVEACGEVGLINNLISEFTVKAPQKLIVIQTCMTSIDYAKIEGEAHSLKSSAAILGAVGLAALCESLEQAARTRLPIAECELHFYKMWPVLDLTLTNLRDLNSSAEATAA